MMSENPPSCFDPVSLQILWGQIVAATDEQSVTIRRTAFSDIVRESRDFSCVILDRDGNLLAQPNQSLPAFTRCASVVMKHFLKRWPHWDPGDVAITNDPWLATGHLHDVAIAVPIFSGGDLVGFSANIAHQADIGGRGYSADASSIFEEGLALPPIKLFKAGRPVDAVFEIIGENVRVPHLVLGDINVQITAARRGAARISEIVTQAGIRNLVALSAQVRERSEAAMVEAIRRMPEGVYENQGMMDGYDKPLRIKVKMTVKDGRIEYDFAGTSPQVGKGINSCYNFTYGYAAYATKAALEPLIPNNEGCYKPIRMVAPEASLVNSRRPAPGNSRGRVGQMIVPVIFGALAKALPDAIPAEVGSPAPRANFSGTRSDGTEFQCLVLTCGGLGAQATMDGVSCKAFPSNTTTASLEVMETGAPIRFHRRELRQNSGGGGAYRGGLGQSITIEVLDCRDSFVSTSADRMDNPPRGYQGGLDGSPAVLALNDGKYLAPKAKTQIAPGDKVIIETPGGGGYGPPQGRSAAELAHDLLLGYVSADKAEKVYPTQFHEAQCRAEKVVSWPAATAHTGQARPFEDKAISPVALRDAGRYQLGVDIGGTFTDFALIDTESGLIHRAKTLSTPDDPVRGILNGIERLANSLALDTRLVGRVVHGTTLVANTIIERKGACTGLITTEGFRDTIEIGSDTRYDIYDLQISFPPPLVPRHRRFGVRGRIGSDGEVVVPLDLNQVKDAVSALVEQGVTSVAVSFLHAYRNPSHEKEVEAFIRESFPELDVSISSEIAPQIREYERTSTVATNAYVRPIMRSYLSRIEHSLVEAGLHASLLVMLSTGGVTSARSASKVPIRLVESGPAGGVIAACHAARSVGHDNIMAFDMGGTTVKICFVNDGQPQFTGSMEVARTKRQFPGSGIPIMVSSIEMVEIGAGGGSIAAVGRTGVLKVGPESASAMPGPACYQLGGTDATVTDADLVLGYVDPKSFLGGEMELSTELAAWAIAAVGDRLGLTVERTAAGILEVVNNEMATAVRTHAAEQGLDYRRYVIVASGGAGPVHVYELARLLGIKTIVCPFGAGTNSALGFLLAPVAVDLVRSYHTKLDSIDWSMLNALYRGMEEEAKATLQAAGVEEVRYERMVEMRYVGQGFEITAKAPEGSLNEQYKSVLQDAFDRTYSDLYGTGTNLSNVPAEALTWRLRAVGGDRRPSLNLSNKVLSGDALKGRRRAYFPESGDFIETNVYDRYALRRGMVIDGPALIEERESTLVVGPVGRVTVADSLDLIVELHVSESAVNG